jgi:hypothetical protein
MLEAHVGIFSDIPGQFNYKANLKYTYFKQKYAAPKTSGARENRIIIDWDLHNNYNGASKYGLSGVCKIYNDGDDAASLSVVALTPYYHIKSSNLNFTLGARADFEVDGRKEHIVSPHIRFSCNPSNTFAFYASALGGRTDNGNYSMFYENRYVSPAERIRDSRTYLDGTTGVRYLPVSNLCLDVFVGYRLTEDEHFFTPLYELTALSAVDETTSSMLTGVSYGTDRVAKLGVQVNYAVQDLWGVDLKGTFYRWNIDGNIGSGGLKPEAYHKPRFEAEADVYFRMSDIPLRMDLTFKGMFGRRTVALPVQPYLKMKDAYDLFVKANYTVAPYFFVNLSANNLLFRNYDIWYGYPAQKFNIMGGISILF